MNYTISCMTTVRVAARRRERADLKDGTHVRSPRNVQYLRKTNRGAILRQLVGHGQRTRVELAEALGLTKMAISTIVADLLREGLVEELKPVNTEDSAAAQNIGRRPTTLSIPELRVNAVGILITRHELQCLAMDITGRQIDQTSIGLPEGVTNADFERMLISEVSRMLRAHKGLKFAGIGVSSLGPLDIADQVLLYPPNFRGLGGIKIGKLLKNEFHLPVFIENDMNAAALAELYYGLGRDTRNLTYVGFTSGVGAGAIVDGTMLHGGSGFAGELGHVSTDLNGPLCSCGQRGCLEVYTSTDALLQATGAESVQQLRQMARERPMPGAVQRCMEQYMRAISSALVTVANLFDPDIIILGERHGLLGPEQLQTLSERLNTSMFQHGFRTIRIAPSSFGAGNLLIGGATLVFQEIFHGRLAV